MGSPSYWGKLVNFEAALRKPGFIPFGLFNPQDDLSFIADMPGVTQSLSSTSVTYSSNMAIDTNAANVITILLTGDLTFTLTYGTSSTIPNGHWVYIWFIQDGSGNHSVTFPANILTDPFFSVDPGANRATVLPLKYNTSRSKWEFFAVSYSVPVT